MQKSTLTHKKKIKILVAIAGFATLVSVTFSLYHNFQDNEIYFGIHLASVTLGAFLSIVGTLTFLEFRTRRLFLVMCAFIAITLAEGISTVNFIIPIIPIDTNIHSFITHSMILLMLSFFSVGIFRTD